MFKPVVCSDTKEACFSYEDYLQSKHWKRFRLKALKHHGKICMLCGVTEVNFFHVHHLTYENLGNEKLEDVVVLCPECHSIVHIEGFNIKPHMKHMAKPQPKSIEKSKTKKISSSKKKVCKGKVVSYLEWSGKKKEDLFTPCPDKEKLPKKKRKKKLSKKKTREEKLAQRGIIRNF